MIKCLKLASKWKDHISSMRPKIVVIILSLGWILKISCQVSLRSGQIVSYLMYSIESHCCINQGCCIFDLDVSMYDSRFYYLELCRTSSSYGISHVQDGLSIRICT